MIIEFFGLPGVGKSTLADQLRSSLHDAGYSARVTTRNVGPKARAISRYFRKMLMILLMLVRHPRAATQVLRSLRHSNQRPPVQAWHRWVDWMVAQALLVEGPSSGFAILEQGSLQAIWSMGIRGDLGGPLDAIVQTRHSWLMPDVVVAVEAPLDQISARLDARGSQHSRLQEDGHLHQGELDRAERLMSAVLTGTESIGLSRESTITIQNTEGSPPAEVAAVLARTLIELSGAGP